MKTTVCVGVCLPRFSLTQSLASTVCRFVQESFAPVYADSGSEWIDERVSLSPLGFNRSILDARRLRQNGSPRRVAQGSCCDSEASTDTTRFRPPPMIKYIRKGWALLPGSPGAYISPLAHHDDAATAVAAALSASQRVSTMPSMTNR